VRDQQFHPQHFLTYRVSAGKFGILRGLLLFSLVCSVGLLANVGVAFSVYDQGRSGG
jgi:dolichol-phosphate mannosyltransferase